MKTSQELVVVTGASTGIGKAIAVEMSKAGYSVVAGVRKDTDLKAWADTLNVSPILLDVTQDSSCEQALQKLKPQFESAARVHLINNAGIAVLGPVETLPMEKWHEQFEVNVFGLIRVTQKFLPWIRKTQGRIVNMSSVSGRAASPFITAYSSSKFAVESISDGLRREMKPFGVKVIVIEPGAIDTPIWNKGAPSKEEAVASLPPSLVEVYRKTYSRFIELALNLARNAAPVKKVSDAALKSIASKNPKTRYVVGNPSVFFESFLSYHLPDKWVDRMVDKMFD